VARFLPKPHAGIIDTDVERGDKVRERIEALRSKLRRIFDPKERILNIIRSLTPRQAAGNALAAGFNGAMEKP